MLDYLNVEKLGKLMKDTAINIPIIDDKGHWGTTTLDTCKHASIPTTPQPCGKSAKSSAQKKETPMRNDINLNLNVDHDYAPAPFNHESEARSHLQSRLYSVGFKHETALEKQFFIREPDGPKTVGEFKERIAKGEFSLDFGDKKDDDKVGYDENIRYVFSWRKPDQKKDRDGFNAAYEKLSEAQTKAGDVINVLPLEKGLEALREFEGWTLQ